MKMWLKRWMLTLAVTAGAAGIVSGVRPWSTQVAQAEPQSSSVDDLKSQAFQALKEGNFERTHDLLGRAATLANDPVLARWVNWSGQFTTQREGFIADQQKQYEKAVGDIEILRKAHKDSYLIDYVRSAHLLAVDKMAFRNLPWVDEIISEVDRAGKGIRRQGAMAQSAADLLDPRFTGADQV